MTKNGEEDIVCNVSRLSWSKNNNLKAQETDENERVQMFIACMYEDTYNSTFKYPTEVLTVQCFLDEIANSASHKTRSHGTEIWSLTFFFFRSA